MYEDEKARWLSDGYAKRVHTHPCVTVWDTCRAARNMQQKNRENMKKATKFGKREHTVLWEYEEWLKKSVF
jgi:hypothetical protein